MGVSVHPFEGMPVATQAEQEAETALNAAVTPGRQHFHPSAAKAWVSAADEGTLAIDNEYNVASVDDDATGDYGINWDVDFAGADFPPVMTARGGAISIMGSVEAKAAGSIDTLWMRVDTGLLADPDNIYVVAFGDHV